MVDRTPARVDELADDVTDRTRVAQLLYAYVLRQAVAHQHRAAAHVTDAQHRELVALDAAERFAKHVLGDDRVARLRAARVDRRGEILALRVQAAREIADNVERVDLEPARETAHLRVDADVGVTARPQVLCHFAQRAAPADTEAAHAMLLEMFGNELRDGAAEQARYLLLVFGRRHDYCGVESEFANEHLLERYATRQLRVEGDTDETVAARVTQQAVDSQARGAKPARYFRLREALHEIQPGGPHLGLVMIDRGRHGIVITPRHSSVSPSL